MLNKKVSEIMTKDVLTVNPDLDVVNAFEKLMEHKISALPVVDGEVLLGIITASDVGHNLILDKYELGTSVEEIMVKSVVTVSPDDSIKKAVEVMKSGASGSNILNQLPVVDNNYQIGRASCRERV